MTLYYVTLYATTKIGKDAIYVRGVMGAICNKIIVMSATANESRQKS